MSDTRYECAICLSDYSIVNMRSTKCGHTFCAPCLKTQLKRSQKKQTVPSCAVCRKDIEGDDVHQIFLAPVVPKSLVDGLGQMDVNAKSVSVNRAAEKLRRSVSGTNGGHTSEEILQAALDFKERIAPKIEEANALKQELEKYRAMFTTALRDARKDAEKERDNAIRERDQALAWAEVSVKELSGARTELSIQADSKAALEMYNSDLVAENTNLKGKHDTMTEELKNANTSIAKYRSSIIHLKERLRRQDDKIADLNERTNLLKEQSQIGTENEPEEEPTQRMQVSQPRKRPRLEAEAGFTMTDLAFNDDSLFFEGLPKSLSSKEISPGNNWKRKAKPVHSQPLHNLNCLASGPKRTIRIPKH